MAKGSRIEVKVTGADVIRKKLMALGKKWAPSVEKALYQESSIVMDDAHDRTPRDRGTLRGTYDLKVKRSTGQILATISVGGPTAQYPQGAGYAQIVHENGPKAAGPGERFYLKNAVDAVRHTIGDRVGWRIRQKWGLK